MITIAEVAREIMRVQACNGGRIPLRVVVGRGGLDAIRQDSRNYPSWRELPGGVTKILDVPVVEREGVLLDTIQVDV